MKSSFRKLCIPFVAVLVFIGFMGVDASSAAANSFATRGVGQTLAGGPGHPEAVWAGTWLWNGHNGFCIDFSRHNPDGSGSTKLTGDLPGMSTGDSARAKAIANRFHDTTSKTAAANAALAIWSIQGEAVFRRWYRWAKSHGVIAVARVTAINRILVDSRNHGPYSVSVNVTEALVGQTTSGTVTATASNDNPAPHLAVIVTPSANAQIVSADATTNSHGVVTFTQQRTDLGRVTVTAVVSAPSSKTVVLTLPSAGNQRLLVGGFIERVKGVVSYDKETGAVTIKSVCDTNCNGVSTMTFSYCNETGASTIHWVESVGGAGAATLDVAGGDCAEKSVQMNDGTQVSSSYCYLGGNGQCATAVVTLPGTYQVVCPAWAQAMMSLSCDCKGTTALVVVTAPDSSPRFYTADVAVNGTVVKALSLVNGQATTVDPGAVKVGDNVSVSFTVYQDSDHTQRLATHKLCGMTITE